MSLYLYIRLSIYLFICLLAAWHGRKGTDYDNTNWDLETDSNTSWLWASYYRESQFP